MSGFKLTLFVLLTALVVRSALADHAGEHALTPGEASRSQPAATPALSSDVDDGSQSGGLSVLERLGQSVDAGQSADEFLEPDVAFVLSAEVQGPNTVVVRWELADTYYLYRDKFKFAVREPPGVQLGEPRMEPGKVKQDDYFGRVEVYYHEAQAVIPLQRATTNPVSMSLDVGYQGCTDLGLCYPPITKTVTLELPPPSAVGAAVAVPESSAPVQAAMGELPEQDRIARYLASGNSLTVLGLFFGFGLLLTFTPCVFPMIPILSSIIVGQGSNIGTRTAFMLSLVFVLAMAATYTAAGVLAGLFGAGANLQVASQDPWVLSAFIIVFVLLALSMFGLYDLQVPASWQTKLSRLSNRQQGGSYIGVGIMGFLSALIVGPCVAAPLAGALIYIGQTGDAVLGGMALFALSMGMGMPVLAVGTSGGKLLPKAGAWMAGVKSVFGVLLLGVAIYLLERIVPEWITLLLWGVLMVSSAIYLGALDTITQTASGWRRLSKGAGLVVMVYGLALMIGGLSGGNDVLRPLQGLSVGAKSDATRSLVFKQVKGLDGLQAELRDAAALGKPAMLDFYADWCVSCKELEKYTFSDPGVQAALANAVVLQADVTANDGEDQALLEAFGLFGPPAILFFGPDGKERPEFRVVGFVKAEPFRTHVVNAIGGRGAGFRATGREALNSARTPMAADVRGSDGVGSVEVSRP
jgi:thiol:disulfide interchange protein DsbD